MNSSGVRVSAAFKYCVFICGYVCEQGLLRISDVLRKREMTDRLGNCHRETKAKT